MYKSKYLLYLEKLKSYATFNLLIFSGKYVLFRSYLAVYSKAKSTPNNHIGLIREYYNVIPKTKEKMNLYQEKDLQNAEYWVCKSIKDVVTEKMQERKMSLYELHKLSGVAHCYCAKAMNGEVINIYHLARIFKVLEINYIFL